MKKTLCVLLTMIGFVAQSSWANVVEFVPVCKTYRKFEGRVLPGEDVKLSTLKGDLKETKSYKLQNNNYMIKRNSYEFHLSAKVLTQLYDACMNELKEKNRKDSEIYAILGKANKTYYNICSEVEEELVKPLTPEAIAKIISAKK